MKILLLNGHGINMRVDGAKLHIKDGRYTTLEEPEEYVFSPKRCDLDNIVIYGKSGNISIDAIRWLIKHKVQITILNWDGKLLTTMLPPESVQVKTKFMQYNAYSDNKVRIPLAKKFIEAKFERTKTMLEWLNERYPTINVDLSKEVEILRKVKSVPEILIIEARVAKIYWQEFSKIVPEKYEFGSRMYTNRPSKAGDMVNCMFNYGYALLEAECLKAINSTGLDRHVGFLHEMAMGKNSLAYDIQEPFRFLVDMSVISLIENDSIKKSDFIRTENYNLRLKPCGVKKLITEFNHQMNHKVSSNGDLYHWHSVILLKTRELAQFLVSKSGKVNFSIPKYELERQDNDDIRRKIIDISYTEWKNRGFSKGSLYYMKKNAKDSKPFALNEHVRKRLEEWDTVAL